MNNPAACCGASDTSHAQVRTRRFPPANLLTGIQRGFLQRSSTVQITLLWSSGTAASRQMMQEDVIILHVSGLLIAELPANTHCPAEPRPPPRSEAAAAISGYSVNRGFDHASSGASLPALVSR